MPGLSYRPTRKDLLDACRLHDLGVVLGRRMLAIACAYTAGVGTLLYFGLSLFYSSVVACLAAATIAVSVSVLALILRHLILPPYLVRRLLSEKRALRGEWHLTWSQQGYAVHGETASSAMAWGHYVRWRENGRVILLYQSWQSYQFVPKRILPPGAEEFIRTQLRTAGVPEAPSLPPLDEWL